MSDTESAAAVTADETLMMDALGQAQLRREMLQWAISTAKTGEPEASVVARAEAYLQFVSYPLRRTVARAMAERQGAPLN